MGNLVDRQMKNLTRTSDQNGTSDIDHCSPSVRRVGPRHSFRERRQCVKQRFRPVQAPPARRDR